MGKRIFIVDDEPDMVKIGTDLLQDDGYLVHSSTHPTDALKQIRENPPDLLLLDIRLPDMDGLQVCREIKSDPKIKHIPIIMVSVKSDEADIVVGLELGAEDYIAKPFRKRELLARVRAVLRRAKPDKEVQVLDMGELHLDYGSFKATLNKKPLNLTPKEFELLGFMMQNEGRVVTRPFISEKVWGIEFTGSTRTIDVHMDQIRKKLGKQGAWIHSLKGVGYRFERDE